MVEDEVLDKEEEEEPTPKVVEEVVVRLTWSAVGVERRWVNSEH